MSLLAIAGVTFREAVRRKLHVNLLLFALLLIVASLVASSLTVGDMRRIAVDLGLSAMEVMGTLTAVFLGGSLVAGDIERRGIYPVLAKPVSRVEYLLGRYLGLAATLWLSLLAMAATLSVLLVIEAGSYAPVDGTLVAAFLMLGVQFLVVAAVAVFFSAVTSPTLAAIFALSVALAGHMSNDLRTLWRGEGASVGRALWYLIPNLSALSINDSVIYRSPAPPSAWWACLYALFYGGAALALAAACLERRDLR